ncbi:MAG: DUF2934 domain-containing protein [Planctomycetota bacterium]|nr:DUF2934 domain-containing protein [Planctomycetota bacterium]
MSSPRRPHPPLPHHEVAALAHELYVEEGRPAGRSLDHWLMAEAILRGERGHDVHVNVKRSRGLVRLEMIDSEILGLDERREQELESELESLVRALPKPEVVVDLIKVTYLSPALLGALAVLNRRARLKGGKVLLTNVAPNLRQEIHICRLDNVLLEVGPNAA